MKETTTHLDTLGSTFNAMLDHLRQDGHAPAFRANVASHHWESVNKLRFLQFLETRGLAHRFLEPPAAPVWFHRSLMRANGLDMPPGAEDEDNKNRWWGLLEIGTDDDRVWLWSFETVGHGHAARTILLAAHREATAVGLLDQYHAHRIEEQRGEARTHIFVRGEPVDTSEPRPTGLGWDDIVLPAAMKADIRCQIESFASGPERYRRMGIPYRRGFLFVGPPGNGKTLLCKVIAATVPLPFFVLRANSIEYTEGSELSRMVAEAGRLAPAILCLEDLDSLLHPVSDANASYFLNLLDGLASTEGLLYLATTNHPERLDPALKDRPARFDRVWRLDLPAADERRKFLESLADGRWTEDLIETAVQGLEGYSMAYVRELYVSACLAAMDLGHESVLAEDVRQTLEHLRRHHDGAKADFEEGGRVGFGKGK